MRYKVKWNVCVDCSAILAGPLRFQNGSSGARSRQWNRRLRTDTDRIFTLGSAVVKTHTFLCTKLGWSVPLPKWPLRSSIQTVDSVVVSLLLPPICLLYIFLCFVLVLWPSSLSPFLLEKGAGCFTLIVLLIRKFPEGFIFAKVRICRASWK